MREHFDELEADFQEYYNLDIALVDKARAARLLFQLPSKSRTFVKQKPELQWGYEELFANKMVFYLETLVWQKSKDAAKKFPLLQPKLFIPEFMQAVMTDPTKTTIDGEAHTTEDIKDLLARPRKEA